jgi:hypothetical protein
MTVQQDVQRAGLRLLMADPTPLPNYADDPKTLVRVGIVIGEASAQEERHVRASDSGRDTAQEEQPSGAKIWLLSVAVCVSCCTMTLLGVLAYWRFA